MSDNTRIEWADATVNYINGCTLVSAGCTNCYAARLAATRLKRHPSRAGLARLNAAGIAKFTGEVRANENALTQVMGWQKPRRIFWNAHGDTFHDAVEDEWIARMFAVAALTPQHTHMILTKRPERMRDYLSGDWATRARHEVENLTLPTISRAAGEAQDRLRRYTAPGLPAPLENVWLGVSVEDQDTADERIPHLLDTPATVRFLSCEPLLGPVDLTRVTHPRYIEVDALTGYLGTGLYGDYGPRLSWVIAGGESGPGARPMHPQWARSLRDQCQKAGVAFTLKQWGAWITPEQSDTDKIGDPPSGDAIKWLREDGLVSDRPVSALAPGGLDPDEGETRIIGGEEVTIYPNHQWRPVAKVGKSRSGRLLDGRTWDEVPHA